MTVGQLATTGTRVPFRSGATEETSLAPAADCDECASALLPGHSNVSLIILVLLMISTGAWHSWACTERLRRPVLERNARRQVKTLSCDRNLVVEESIGTRTAFQHKRSRGRRSAARLAGMRVVEGRLKIDPSSDGRG